MADKKCNTPKSCSRIDASEELSPAKSASKDRCVSDDGSCNPQDKGIKRSKK